MEGIFKIEGMSCSACAAHVEKAAAAVNGVERAEVNLTANTLRLVWNGDECSEADVAAAIKRAGYEMLTEKNIKNGGREDRALKGKRITLILSVILLIPIMYLSMAHMLKLPLPETIAAGSPLNVALQLVLCIPVIIMNFSFFKRGIPMLFRGHPNMDTLIAIGSGTAFIYSIYVFIMQLKDGFAHADGGEMHHAVYFETAAMILTLVSVGKYLESRAKASTGSALERLNGMLPATAELVIGETVKTVNVSELNRGDIILVREGVSVPADGTITEGGGSVDESGLTGESVPVDKVCGDTVKAGTVNLSGVFRMQVQTAGGDTVIAKMVRLVQDAAATKAPIARIADKVSGVFVPVVMIIAAVTAVVWYIISRDFETALKTAVTVLVVSCPCSLGLATPVAVTAAVYKSAEVGVLVKSAELFELLEKADTVVLDKTGTVTTGLPSVRDVKCAEYGNADDGKIIKLSAMLEAASNHPFAAAFLREAGNLGINEIVPAQNYENIPGRGIKGDIDGKTYYIGNLKFAEETLKKGLPADILSSADNAASNGETPLLLFDADGVIGCTFISDTVKPEAAEAVKMLRKRGKSVVMLTGDNERTAASIAAAAGIKEFRAGVYPHEKESYIKELEASGRRTVMVGDGINDSAALTCAAVGIAMGSGTDIAIESADCVLMKNSLYDIINLFDISRYSLRIIKQNLFWALFYNCLCIPVAAGVLAPIGISFSPMLASAAMSLSSLFVVTNALRIMHIKPLTGENGFSGGPVNTLEDGGGESTVRSQETFDNGICADVCNAEDGNDNFDTRGMFTMKYELHIEEMMCQRCKAHIEKALSEVKGVKATVDLEAKKAYCECAEELDTETLTAAVKAAGYDVDYIKKI